MKTQLPYVMGVSGSEGIRQSTWVQRELRHLLTASASGSVSSGSGFDASETATHGSVSLFGSLKSAFARPTYLKAPKSNVSLRIYVAALRIFLQVMFLRLLRLCKLARILRIFRQRGARPAVGRHLLSSAQIRKQKNYRRFYTRMCKRRPQDSPFCTCMYISKRQVNQ